MVDFALLPPEINSTRMYSGAGSGPLFMVAAAWDGLAAGLEGSASSFDSVITGLASGPWVGPASVAMTAAAARYAGWLNAAAGQAGLAAGQARVAATSFEMAFAATVHPAAVTANRMLLGTLIATNWLGQNTPAIAATEFHYAEMWAQDVAAMVGYHAGASSVAATLMPFSAPPTGLAGLTSSTGMAAVAAQAQSLASEVPVSSVLSAASMLISPMMSLAQSANGGTAGLAGVGPAGLAGDVKSAAAVPLPGMKPLGGGESGSAMSGGLGQARLVGSMSVPPTWPGSMPARMASSAMSGFGGMPDAAALAAEAGTGSGGNAMMPMMMPMGGTGAGGGMPGGMMGRGGASPHVVVSPPSVIPRAGV